ncbi:MAG: SMP-30/gluconolactonase/LRE family protein [Deltaproteobacteria bacterium]|nr:SMP-30/gluconolactonase/LRE family protein [Deltaproteobacteria bacterium]MBW2548169.1 SMP-30/gluconolactonase/LRE family protein [Deltaproteobacteria bacterium]
MNKCLILASAAVAILMGCGSTESSGTGGVGGVGGVGGTAGTGGTSRSCATDIDAGEVQPFGGPTPMRTEGITFDAGGNLFVSAIDTEADDELLSVTTEGTFTVAAEAESILGLESHSSGIIAAAIATGELLLIDPATGDVDPIATGLGAPNFVVTTPWDTMLVSDDSIGEDTIDEVTWDGDVSTWVAGVPTPNGMVFSLDERTLYVATTFEEPGLWRVPVSEDGQAGTPEKWITFENATTPDGVAIDSEGNVYVALNLAAQIAKVDPEGNVTIIAEDVASAASLAFGQGDFDPCSLYVTSLFETQLWRVGTGIPGTEK